MMPHRAPHLLLLFLACTALLGGCGAGQVTHYGVADGPKTVNLPAGGNYPLADLKRVLVEAGWQVAVEDGLSCSEDRRPRCVVVESRYRLAGRWRHLGTCFDGRPGLRYDMALVDRRDGSEVFTLWGNGCLADPVGDFARALQASSPTAGP